MSRNPDLTLFIHTPVQARVRFSLAGFIIFSDYISERIDG